MATSFGPRLTDCHAPLDTPRDRRRSMRAPRVAGGEWLLVLLAGVALAPVVRGECWIRSDGVEICTEDPVGWLMMWWIWLMVLLVAGMILGYCDCWPGESMRRCRKIQDAKIAEDASLEEKAAFRAPLLAADHGTGVEHGDDSVEPKQQPEYRYLDE